MPGMRHPYQISQIGHLKDLKYHKVQFANCNANNLPPSFSLCPPLYLQMPQFLIKFLFTSEEQVICYNILCKSAGDAWKQNSHHSDTLIESAP